MKRQHVTYPLSYSFTSSVKAMINGLSSHVLRGIVAKTALRSIPHAKGHVMGVGPFWHAHIHVRKNLSVERSKLMEIPEEKSRKQVLTSAIHVWPRSPVRLLQGLLLLL